ncbi:hypothetical protein AZE42_03909 [Rhizopogon vesiculosus]|uniref:Uncharacterized protein n=1 Tax=Rhizopogon vesiculosus TaxID=180088 RepID=A0A1J8QBY6_9AGAM|nr:hypothetical protein AZE42_03909 [Rhizopogon vesiculosus]
MAHPSLLSVVHDVLEHIAYNTVTAQLGAILNTTHHLNHALMKEHTALTSSTNQSTSASMSLSYLVRGGNRAIYPDTSPPNINPAKIAEWGRNLGMEAFVDGSITVLAGKVLVLDIDHNDHVAVKMSFANSNNNTGNTSAAPELDAFLVREVTRWIHAAKCASGIDMISGHSKEDPAIEAARRSREIQQHFRYLMMLVAGNSRKNKCSGRQLWYTVFKEAIRSMLRSFGGRA